MAGIVAFGAYIPRLRLSRRAVAEANAWFNPGLKAHAEGERAICNWDEDPVTMAVEAARDALGDRPRENLQAIRFASTTFPFTDRLNAGIVAAALNAPSEIAAQDVTASQRAATSALIGALKGGEETLVVAADKRPARSGSGVELTAGDGAAAVITGEGEPVARLLASASHTADFVDHYRSPEMEFDYLWEERWVRDAGYLRIVPPGIQQCLDAAGVDGGAVTHFCMPATLARVGASVAKASGLPDGAVRDALGAACGDTGAAHPIVMLVAALEEAKPGDRILLVGFGQGADALLFEVTPAIEQARRALGVKGHLARRREEANYAKFLAFNDLVELERGMRAETDKLTPLSALWRNRETVTGFIGGRCTRCGTLQFPKSKICVNPNCNAWHTQEPHPFADMVGRINSYTADRLTYSPDPPACYGMVQFEAGGRTMMDFTDVDPERLEVGQRMRMMFRIKDVDAQRGFRRYFWKAAPLAAEA
jgi:3-hydroxy-3-methylglutaryl CoA synthase